MDFPQIGFGTYKIKEQEEIDFVLKTAIEKNYFLIDTAEVYKNQKQIGNFLKNNIINRENIWITTKLSFHAMKKGEKAINTSIQNTFNDLGVDYIDLFLIHAPIEQTYVYAWNKLRELQKENKIRYIGVSNFTVSKLEKFIGLIGHEEAKYIFCNQFEFSPFLNRNELVTFCKKNNIHVTVYGLFYKINNVIEDIANKLGKTVYQVLLTWAIQKGLHVIPMAKEAQHIEDNINLDFTLNDEDMDKLNSLDENFSLYPWYLD